MKIIFSFEFKISSEVKITDLFIFRKFFSRSMFENLALNQQIGPVTNGKGFIYVVVGDENTYVFVFKPGYDSLNILYSNWINTSKWFIQ